ncbi:MAG: hypothetical protein FJY42_12440 [Betaproteobacteria bacterium]|nr:hypothetical protein [Betaproteobacteria bacterium]
MPMSLPLSRLLAPSIATCLCLLSVAGHTQTSPYKWETFASAEDTPRLSLAQNAGLIVFIRRPEASSGLSGTLPTDILVDERLHTSLLPGGFSEAQVCPGLIELKVGGQATNGLRQRPSLLIEVKSNSITYIEVAAPTAPRPFRAASGDPQPSMQGLRRQVHALSRLPSGQECRTAPPGETLMAAAPLASSPSAPQAVPPTAGLAQTAVAATPRKPAADDPVPSSLPEKRRHTLSGEMLFRFGGYRVKDLSPQGHAELVRIARTLRERPHHIQSVVIQGHTDPMGPPATHQRIANERAQTVRKILMTSGLPAHKIRAEGLGIAQLLVADCKKQGISRDDQRACNAPNRRVEIVITAIRHSSEP